MRSGGSSPNQRSPRYRPEGYDDASWHYDGEFPKGLPPEAGATRIGIFLAWAIHRDLVAAAFREGAPEAFESGAQTGETGAQFLMQQCDEQLIDEDLSEEGSAFAQAYYEQKYYTDYCARTRIPSPTPWVSPSASTSSSHSGWYGLL
jgi:hypothetical protein